MEADKKIFLAIESGICGGSLSVFRNGEEIGGWIGRGSVSRSEDILQVIAELLAAGQIERRSLGRIIVSDGPGSLTGLRIGISTALGLKAALKTRVQFVSILPAMRNLAAGTKIFSAVPKGNNKAIWSSFNRNEKLSAEENNDDLSKFIKIVEKSVDASFVLHADLFKEIVAALGHQHRFINAGNNLARILNSEILKRNRRCV